MARPNNLNRKNRHFPAGSSGGKLHAAPLEKRPTLQPQMTAEKSGSMSLKLFGSRRKCLVIMIEPRVAFLPRLGFLTAKLSAKYSRNEGMCVEMSRIMRIFTNSEESCS